MPILLNKTLRLFLDSIGRREEYEFYLERFRTDRQACFALLVPDRSGFDDVASVFTFDLHFLQRLELAPTVLLHGPDADAMARMLLTDDHPYAAMDMDAGVDGVPAFVEAARQSHKIALLRARGGTLEEHLLRLLPTVSRRLHFIRIRGALRDVNEEPLLYFHTATSDRLALAEADRPLADLAALLLDRRPGLHISVASPWKLLNELFTVKGAGCVIRRGSVIRRHDAPSTVDAGRLRALLEESFGRALRDANRLPPFDLAYVEEHYRGAALLRCHPAGMYLSKFAVGTQARGEGLANELWREATRDHAALFWRARADNPINHWYDKQADGSHRDGPWKVFWRGIPWARITDVIRYSLEQPADFAP